jgi:hypothetical protein
VALLVEEPQENRDKLESTYRSKAPDEFYVLAPSKLVIMLVATMGIYSIYWFYQNWMRQRHKHNEDIWPLARALFAIFFAHRLFRRIDTCLSESTKGSEGETFVWGPMSTATQYVVLAVLSSVINRLSVGVGGDAVLDLLSIIVMIISFWFLNTAQEAINFALGDPEGASNSSFLSRDISWCIIGGFLWLLTIQALLNPVAAEL